VKLSILCVTKFERHALTFIADMRQLATDLQAELVLAADGHHAYSQLRSFGYDPKRVDSRGFVESVLDEAIRHCTGDYVLRLDDDEKCSPAMGRWLAEGAYLAAPHWKFPRAHLWYQLETFREIRAEFITHPLLFPDHQTRLSHRGLAGGRNLIHAGSPHGGGEIAPVCIEHWKFLVKTVEERRAIAKRYDEIQPGAGTNFLAFSVPEDAFESIPLAPYHDGSVPEVRAA
jgi:hypothetical protein